MSLYAVIDVTVKDREKLKEYVAGHLPTIAQYGGKILCDNPVGDRNNLPHAQFHPF